MFQVRVQSSLRGSVFTVPFHVQGSVFALSMFDNRSAFPGCGSTARRSPERRTANTEP